MPDTSTTRYLWQISRSTWVEVNEAKAKRLLAIGERVKKITSKEEADALLAKDDREVPD